MPAKKIKEKPSVSIIGAGRLGTALAVALGRHSYPIRAVVARQTQNARKAAAHLDGNVEAYAASRIGSLPQSDLIVISTPDDQISAVAGQLGALNHNPTPIVLHTSGALSSEVLLPLQAKGWSTGSVHPLISVSDAKTSIDGAFWSVEGDWRAVRLAKTLVRDLGGTSFSIRTADKPLYHAAAVMTSGNVTALFDVALEMLVECGLTRKTARRILQPLLTSTVHNLEIKDPAEALTGTFSRGDVETVKRHLAALKDHELETALKLYRLLGERSLQLTKSNPQITQILESV
jgi:predicted short-subunit dehydrogenase-like oxidoreductase (DUF2520 family)